MKNTFLKLVETCARLVVPSGHQRKASIERFPERLLIAKAAGLGDGVLVRALLVSLKLKHPSLELGLLVCPPTREILSCGIDARVHFFDPQHAGAASILRTVCEIRQRRYDAALDFEQGTVLSPALAMAARIPIRIGGYLAGATSARAALLTHSVEFRETDSMLASFLRLTRVLDPEMVVADDHLAVPCEVAARRRADEILERDTQRGHGHLVVFHLGPLGWGEYRRWPIERFVELADRMRAADSRLVIILTGTRSEGCLGQEFSVKYIGTTLNLCGQCSVEETAALLERCDLVVSSDTGVMHLGAAMGTPTVGLFGPNTPRHWAPFGPRARHVYPTKLPCSPCINNYRNIRPRECSYSVRSRCMIDIEVADVLAAASRVVHDEWLGTC